MPRPLRRAERLRLILCATALALITIGCTAVDVAGPEPYFVSLIDKTFTFAQFPPEPIAPNRCPVIPPAPATWTKRSIGSDNGTIRLPPEMLGASAGFGREPGIVFTDPSLGVIAIAYDDRLPVLYRRSFFGVSVLQSVCSVVLDGRPATMRLDVYDGSPEFPFSNLLIGSTVVISGTTRSGRPVNVLVTLYDVGRLYDFREANPAIPLWSAALSLAW